MIATGFGWTAAAGRSSLPALTAVDLENPVGRHPDGRAGETTTTSTAPPTMASETVALSTPAVASSWFVNAATLRASTAHRGDTTGGASGLIAAAGRISN